MILFIKEWLLRKSTIYHVTAIPLIVKGTTFSHIIFYVLFLFYREDNDDNIEKVMIVGVSNIAQNGFLSELPNLTVCSMKDSDYQPFFGFTMTKVTRLFSNTQTSVGYINGYYNGYVVPFRTKDGKQVLINLFNPWSVINFKKLPIFKSFWVNISSTLILNSFLQRTIEVPEFSKFVVVGNPIPCIGLQNGLSYSDHGLTITQEILTFMFHAEFLAFDGTFSFLRVPNSEIKETICSTLREMILPQCATLNQLYQCFRKGKIDDFDRFLMGIRFKLFSSFDASKKV